MQFVHWCVTLRVVLVNKQVNLFTCIPYLLTPMYLIRVNTKLYNNNNLWFPLCMFALDCRSCDKNNTKSLSLNFDCHTSFLYCILMDSHSMCLL